MEGEKRVCVTGAGGYLASWLVKLLLSNGYKVHGTVRDPNQWLRSLDTSVLLETTKQPLRWSEIGLHVIRPGRVQVLLADPMNGDGTAGFHGGPPKTFPIGSEKNAHLRKLENASENLQLFKADLYDLDGLAAAIAGCEGVFHVASPVPAAEITNPELELITPAVTGTLNVLEACSKAKVRRVVVVSSVAAVTFTPSWPVDKLKDEECWSDPDFCRITENWYCLAKTLAERAAFEYAEKNKLDVVTVCPSMVFGPLLQPTVNASSLFLLDIMKGGEKPMENMLWHFVDVRDVADALLLVYEKHETSGRYICAPHPSNIRDMVALLKSMYPSFPYTNIVEAHQDVLMTSEKLKKLGWKSRTLEQTITDTVENFQEIGVLERN